MLDWVNEWMKMYMWRLKTSTQNLVSSQHQFSLSLASSPFLFCVNKQMYVVIPFGWGDFWRFFFLAMEQQTGCYTPYAWAGLNYTCQWERQGFGCVTTHWHQPEHQGMGCVTTHWHQPEHQGMGCVTNTLTWARTPRLGLRHNTVTPARTPRLGLSQHSDTSQNTKAWAVSQHSDTSQNTKAWAVSQYTKAILKCYAPHIIKGSCQTHSSSNKKWCSLTECVLEPSCEIVVALLSAGWGVCVSVHAYMCVVCMRRSFCQSSAFSAWFQTRISFPFLKLFFVAVLHAVCWPFAHVCVILLCWWLWWWLDWWNSLLSTC